MNQQPEPNTSPQTAPPTDTPWSTPPTPTNAPWPAPPTPEPRAANGRPKRVTVAAVVAVVLLLVLGINGVAVLAVGGQLRSDRSDLDTELTAQRQARQQAREELQTQYRAADLPGKLRTVRTRKEAATAALRAWGSSGTPSNGLKTVRQARNECAEAVIDYNTTAARFPADMLIGLPSRIKVTDTTNGCGL